MPSNSIYGSKVPKRANPESASGINLSPGPYEAVVMNTIDTTRAGRLQVWIPDLGGGDKRESKNWYTVSYATPYGGMTEITDPKTSTNAFSYVQHTYGFWGVPPDTGNIVLVIFVAGDPNRGYWFATVYNKLGIGMLPGIAGATQERIDTNNIEDPDLLKSLTDESVWPLSAFSETDGSNVNREFMTTKSAPHEFQVKRYLKQGLDRDAVRGANSSSAQREMPSSVVGLSSPGRPLINDTGSDPALQKKITSGAASNKDLETRARKGGHSLVMDDGDFYGKNQMMRLRTTAGHQILMDDTNNNMYVINSEGTCWIELAENGQMHIFTAGGFNLRTKGEINMHSDTNINIHAEENIQMYSGKQIDINTTIFNQVSTDKSTIYGSTVQIGGSSAVNLSSGGGGSFKSSGVLALSGGPIHLNTSQGPTVQQPTAITKLVHDDTNFNDGTGLWEIQPGILNTIVTIVPTHEPWKREGGTSEGQAVSG